MIVKSNQSSPTPTTWQTYRWPLLVVGLLLGHVCLMMFGVTWAMANKPLYTPTEMPTHSPTQAVQTETANEK